MPKAVPIPDTKLVEITLENEFLQVSLLNFGARLYRIIMPDKDGKQENILLSYDDYADVLTDQAFFGAIVGPVAGRIRGGRWADQQLEQNDGQNHIHGGSHGWASQYWSYDLFEKGVVFTLVDTISGYPGPITVTVRYELQGAELLMETAYTSDAQTIVNPTSHAYFNLGGATILTHELQLSSTAYLETDQANLPTGKVLALGCDLHQKTPLKDLLEHFPDGIDDTFLLEKACDVSLILSEATSGRKLTIVTDCPSVVLFSTTNFDAPFMINHQPMHAHFGLAIEPQFQPDIVHFPEWGTIELAAGQSRTTRTSYQFSLSKE